MRDDNGLKLCPELFDREAAGLFHGLGQLLHHLLFGRIGREVKPVEAGVSFGKVFEGRVADQVEGEEPGASGTRWALEGFETLQRHLEIEGQNLGLPPHQGLPYLCLGLLLRPTGSVAKDLRQG